MTVKISSSLNVGLKQFEKLTMDRLDLLMKGLSETGVEMVRSESPVYTGWFMASWRASKRKDSMVVKAPKSTIDGWTSNTVTKGNRPLWVRGRKNNKGIPFAFGTSRMPKDKGLGHVTREDKLYFSNSVPYAGLGKLKLCMVLAIKEFKRNIAVWARLILNGPTIKPNKPIPNISLGTININDYTTPFVSQNSVAPGKMSTDDLMEGM